MQMFGKNVKLITVVMLVTALAAGSATSMGQSLDGNDVTVDPGSDSVRDQLIARLIPMISKLKFAPSDFDFEQIIIHRRGQLAYVPFNGDEQLNHHKQAVLSGERRSVFTGILYNTFTFKYQGEAYSPGLHLVKLINNEAETQWGTTGPRPNDCNFACIGDIIDIDFHITYGPGGGRGSSPAPPSGSSGGRCTPVIVKDLDGNPILCACKEDL